MLLALLAWLQEICEVGDAQGIEIGLVTVDDPAPNGAGALSAQVAIVLMLW
jgi:hypothetical protein